MNRAYTILDVKSVQDDQRRITGIATTPTPDRMSDVIEPLGIKYNNPMPLLWQHKSDQPVGSVTFDTPTAKGVTFSAKIAAFDEPGNLKNRLDEAWHSVKLGLVKGVSIGFRPIEYGFMDDGGIHYLETEVMELSLVTIPAQAEATIQTIKSIDAPLLAASGHGETDKDRPVKPAGVSATKRTSVVRAQEGKPKMAKTISEQITAFEGTRVAKSARMDEIMDAAAEKGETLDTAQMEEYATLESEVKAVDDHLVLLRRREVTNRAAAKAVETVTDVDSGSVARGGVTAASVRSRTVLPKGIGFARYAMTLAMAKGNIMQAAEIANSNEQWKAETPEVVQVLRAAVAAGTTSDATWAGPLVVYQNLQSEFVEYLRPLTIIGRIPGLRRVPFKIKIPRQTGAASVNWVGEGKVKPLTSMAFDTITMDFAKIAGIIPLTEELVRFSNPSAEMLVRDELAAAIIQFMDSQFVDPTKASNDVSPASITYGVSGVAATGTTAAALRADVRTLMATFLASNLQMGSAVWLMTQQTALGISLMVNTLGQQEFMGISMNGGTFLGLPVVTSESIPSTGGSPTDGYPIILVNASDILLADDGQVTLDASREASLQMDSAPDSPPTASTVTISLWQNNMIAIKAERYINWAKRHSGSVGLITNAKYAE